MEHKNTVDLAIIHEMVTAKNTIKVNKGSKPTKTDDINDRIDLVEKRLGLYSE